MKKAVFLVILLIIALPAVSAQGFYFDAGLGFIPYGTLQNDIMIFSAEEYIGPMVGLRVGYGPFANIPLYFIGEFSLHEFVSPGYRLAPPTQTKVGLGAIFYPHRLIQLGASIGPSMFANTYKYEYEDYGYDMNDYLYGRMPEFMIGVGLGWNISAAVDLGKGNHGILMGLGYTGAINNVREENPRVWGERSGPMVSTSLSIFVKYTFRQRGPQQTTATNPVQRQPSSNIGIDGAIGRASRELINNLPENTRLAVISISSNDGNLSTRVVDELEFQLVASRKFTIVNRSALDTIRREQNFQMSGDVSDESAVSIGQLLGANIVIIGSITEVGRNQRLILRALDVRTSEIVTMVREDF